MTIKSKFTVGNFSINAFIGIAAIALTFSASAGDSLTGKVVAVKSGNLITLDYGEGTYDVRIAGVESSKRSATDNRAKEELSEMILGKMVRLRFHGRAPNGDMYGKIWMNSIEDREPVKDVGVELVRKGLMRGHDDDYKYGEMSQAEKVARKAKLGQWK